MDSLVENGCTNRLEFLVTQAKVLEVRWTVNLMLVKTAICRIEQALAASYK